MSEETARTDAGDSAPARQLWEARERVSELEARLAEEVERERILELEVAALGRDLSVKVAYAEALERSVDEQRASVAWLQERFDDERSRAEQLAKELNAERARISYRVINRLISLVRQTRP